MLFRSQFLVHQGDPIPRRDAGHEGEDSPPVPSLAECADGEHFRLSRVLDQSAGFLRYLTDSGLALGTEGRVERNPDGAGLMRVRVGGRSLALALDAAEKLLVARP